MLGLSFTEIAIVAIVALLLLGPDQLPGMAKQAGKWLRDLRRASDDLRGTFENEMSKMDRDLNAPVKSAPKVAPPPPAPPPAPAAVAAVSAPSEPAPAPAAPPAPALASDDMPPWMNLAERPPPPKQAAAEDFVPLDQRSAHQTARRQEGQGDGMRLDGAEDVQPKVEATDPAAQRARLRLASLPPPPAAARAQLRTAAHRLSQPLAPAPVANVNPPQALSAAEPALAQAAATAQAPAVVDPEPAPPTPLRTAPPQTVPRERKRSPRS